MSADLVHLRNWIYAEGWMKAECGFTARFSDNVFSSIEVFSEVTCPASLVWNLSVRAQ